MGYDVQDYFITELQEKLLCNINTRFDRYNVIQMDRDFMYYVSKFELRHNIDSDIWRYTINKDIDSICSLVISMKSGNSIFEFRRWGDKILKLCLKPNMKLMGV